jgi:hypothetical protein
LKIPLINALEFMSIQDLKYHIHVFDEIRAVYVENPKCGCTTIKKTLASMLIGEEFSSSFLHNRQKFPSREVKFTADFVELPDNYLLFTSVRDPYERILSGWLNKIDNSKKSDFVSYERDWLCAQSGLPRDAKIPFENFLEIISSISTQDINAHFKLQWYQTLSPCITYDKIIRLEYFERDLTKLTEHLFPTWSDKPFFNYLEENPGHSTFARNHIANYYTFNAFKIVNKIFEIDFIKFGYPQIDTVDLQ